MTEIEQTQTRHEAFAARLRALADVIEQHPELLLPYDVSVAGRSFEDLDRWSAALTAAGHDVTDTLTDHHREVSSATVAFRVCKVHDEPMRRHYAEQRFLKEHRAEIELLVAEPVSA